MNTVDQFVAKNLVMIRYLVPESWYLTVPEHLKFHKHFAESDLEILHGKYPGREQVYLYDGLEASKCTLNIPCSVFVSGL
jgi:hypothetical protein